MEQSTAILNTNHSLTKEAREARGRIWIDGCFDFSHHGHAGAMLQGRRLGTELYVGVHSDEDILEHKGPTVMNLAERIAAVDACRWSTRSDPGSPYVTQLDYIDKLGCWFTAHGDDIASDSGGEDTYRFVKRAGRFLTVKRTPGISTTDLVGRMLLCTKGHFIRSLEAVLRGEEGQGGEEERKKTGKEMEARIHDYATDETGLEPGSEVWGYKAGKFTQMVSGTRPKPDQRLVYVDGGFDIFSSGHIEFLRQVVLAEEAQAKESGWYTSDRVAARKALNDGKDYPPAFVVAGIHDDEVINQWKGVNYPVMNIFERGLCVLQCRYVHAVVFGAPFEPKEYYLRSLPFLVQTSNGHSDSQGRLPDVIYHGPTAFIPLTYDPYVDARKLGIFKAVGDHAFSHVNAAEIVQRIMKSRALYEERQRRKGEKAVGEEATLRREKLETEAELKRLEAEKVKKEKGIPNGA